MHELSVSSAIVDTVVRHAEGRRVTAVRVRLGRLRQVVPGSLAFYFELVSRETVCDGARLEQELVPAALRCEDCGHEWEIDMPFFRCPVCESAQRDGRDRRGARGRIHRGRGGKRMHRVKVKVVEDALDANATIAAANRADFDRAGVTVVNLMSAPGAGKTSVLERVLGDLGDVRVGVLEGDVQGSLDADRLASLHVPVTQLNTDAGFGGECHLDANMVRSALPSVPLDDLDLLIVENVGNLVCPAEFRIGEDIRVMVSSVAEGDDKPLKYPLMFRTCELVLLNKLDLLEHVDFDVDRFLHHLDAVHPGVQHMAMSARTGAGLDAFRDWLVELAAPVPA